MQRWLDRAIVGLAFGSVLVFALSVMGGLGDALRGALTVVDLAIVAAYAGIFLTKGMLDERPARWFRRHAWLTFALLPLTIPVLVAQPYFLVVQVAILLVRGGKAVDRALHLRVVGGLSERYRARLTEELTQPLLLNLATALEESVVRRDFAVVLGQRIHERRDLIEAAVRRGVESSPRLSMVARIGPVQRWVDDTTREIVDAAYVALSSPETNELLRESFRDAFRELKRGIEEPKWKTKGMGIGEAAHKVAVAAHIVSAKPTRVPVQVAPTPELKSM